MSTATATRAPRTTTRKAPPPPRWRRIDPDRVAELAHQLGTTSPTAIGRLRAILKTGGE